MEETRYLVSDFQEAGEAWGKCKAHVQNTFMPPPQEGPRKPGGRGGGACRAQSVPGARCSREQCRRALKGPGHPIPQLPFIFPTLFWPPTISPLYNLYLPCLTSFHNQSLPQQ